jgi:ABC-type sugar transport system permease subunit
MIPSAASVGASLGCVTTDDGFGGGGGVLSVCIIPSACAQMESANASVAARISFVIVFPFIFMVLAQTHRRIL